jgi:hypothetical protein
MLGSHTCAESCIILQLPKCAPCPSSNHVTSPLGQLLSSTLELSHGLQLYSTYCYISLPYNTLMTPLCTHKNKISSTPHAGCPLVSTPASPRVSTSAQVHPTKDPSQGSDRTRWRKHHLIQPSALQARMHNIPSCICCAPSYKPFTDPPTQVNNSCIQSAPRCCTECTNSVSVCSISLDTSQPRWPAHTTNISHMASGTDVQLSVWCITVQACHSNSLPTPTTAAAAE